LLIFLVLLLDQLVKIQIKTSMTIGQSIYVFGNWFQIRFIENPGMAFGLDIPGKWGKPVLTIFRIIAVVAIGWYLKQLINRKAKTALILCVALIMAGASGNIIDSVFYGRIFSESTYFSVATLFPPEGGYAPVLYGKVVDMLYFPVIHGRIPQWFLPPGEFIRPILAWQIPPYGGIVVTDLSAAVLRGRTFNRGQGTRTRTRDGDRDKDKGRGTKGRGRRVGSRGVGVGRENVLGFE
jgi:signal peptidase II